MNYLLDTCIISDFFKKIYPVLKHFEKLSPTQIHISAVTAMEIEYGLRLFEQREMKTRPIWESLLKQIKVVPFCPHCAIATADIRSQLKKLGLPIGPYDSLLAGTALAHDMIMVTSNLREFNRIEEITIEDWRSKTIEY